MGETEPITIPVAELIQGRRFEAQTKAIVRLILEANQLGLAGKRVTELVSHPTFQVHDILLSLKWEGHMTDQELEQIEKSAEAATPGKWFQCMATIVGADSLFVAELISDQHTDKRVSAINADGRFIALAREAVPKLVAEVKRLREYAAQFTPEQIEKAKHEADALWLTLGDAEGFAREAKAKGELLQKAWVDLKTAREALEWYAEAGNYVTDDAGTTLSSAWQGDRIQEKARAALVKIGKGEG